MKASILKVPTHYLLALVVSFLLCSTPTIQAQTTSPVVMQMVTTELNKRGLTEEEARTALLKEGIDLESIPTAELPQYKTRVTTILDKLEKDKKAGKTGTQAQSPIGQPININVGATPTTNPVTTGQVDSNGNQLTMPTPVAPVTTPEEAAAEATQKVWQAQAAKNTAGSNIYGHSLFTDKSLDIFRTTDGAQAPETYVLGEGDEVHISIFGASQTDIQQRIAPDGSIQPAGVSKLFLKGLTLSQAREVIKKNLSVSYLFRSDQLAVTIVTARTIMVNVFGETKITGGFSLSALNSALNALSVAGGPSEIGSVRSIQLIRGNLRRTIDLYAFMNDPAEQFKFGLQNNDIIFVPVIKKLVSIEGAVKRPMFYEMLPNETLLDLINFAGGLKMNVFPDFVQLQRFVDGEEVLMEYNLKEVRSGKEKVQLLNGDIVRIKAIGKPMDQYVDVEGSVYYPGRFDLLSNSSVSRLLKNAKPNYQAKTDILLIERTRPDSTIEILTVPFPDSKKKETDFALQPKDRVRILDQVNYRDIDTISVSGHVRKPFAQKLGLNDRITVKQAIDMAGGLKTSAYPVAYIFRRNLFNPVEMKYIRIELDQAANIELQPGDNLNIYDNVTYTNVGKLNVFGAVKTPKGFTYDPSMKVSDLLTNAGGFAVGAAFNRVEVFRTILSPTEKAKLEMISLTVDSNYQVVTPANFTLQPYDQIVVRMTPEFTLGRTIELNGQVKYPGTYVLESKQTRLSDIVKKAGGLLSDADPFGAKMFRTYKNRGQISMNVKKAMHHVGNNAQDPILFEGDIININRLENTVSIYETGTRMAQYSTERQSDSIKNMVFQGTKSAAWYIRNFAGGFQKNADRNSVTVTLPNNQMVSTKRFLIFFNNYPTVQSGSAITMKMDIEKVYKDAQPKEKYDWESTLSKSLSTLMSTLSIILLMQKL